MKKCAACKTEKPLDEFTIVKKLQKPHSYCKACMRDKQRARWADPAQREILKARQNARYHANREQRRAQAREKYATDLEFRAKAREQARRYVEANRKRIWARRRELKYGLPEEEYLALREAQNQACAICQSPLGEGGKCVVDHCHTTQKVRGVLCRRCNLGIGSFDDDPAVLRRAAEYLAAHGHDLV